MCGIIGYFGINDSDVGNFLEVLAHRGPDSHGSVRFPEFGGFIGHTRLSIIDRSERSNQPMETSDGRLVIAYNGELYNYIELSQRMMTQGGQLLSRGDGDTGVLLEMLRREGMAALHQLNGMFTFALWDKEQSDLLLVRDGLGVKPLYWCEPRPGAIAFSSEIKALLQIPGVKRRAQNSVLLEHLTFCHATSEDTAFVGIRRLAPGGWLRWNARTKTINHGIWWKPSFTHLAISNREEAISTLATGVRKAVGRQMVADVPVGAFLSGGLDSSLITAFAAGVRPEQFHCFTITYPAGDDDLDRGGDDPIYARTLVSRLGVELHEIAVRPNVADLLPKLIWHLDEPLADPAAISCYLMSREARARGIPVLLSGQGADELFGGYPRYRVMAARQRLKLPQSARAATAWLARQLPGGRGGRLGVMARRVRKALSGLGMEEDEQFLALCSPSPAVEAMAVLAPDLRALAGDPAQSCRERFRRVGLSGADRYLERDLMVYLSNHNLLYTDKMSMAASVEARVPFLDTELVAMATAIPAEWKLQPSPKAILRQAAAGIIEDDIIHRPKAGLGAPHRTWLKRDLHVMWNDLFNESAVKRRGWFDYHALQDIRARSLAGRDDLYMLQWAVLTIELWAQQFLDQVPRSV